MISGLGEWLIFCGAILTLLGVVANRYHTTAFSEHQRRLHRLHDTPNNSALTEEVEQFYDDRALDIATALIFLEPLGVFCLLVGVALIHL